MDIGTPKTATTLTDEVWSAFYGRLNRFRTPFYRLYGPDIVTDLTQNGDIAHVSG